MGKVDAQMQARMDGMAYALKIARERGISGLENDIKARGILGVNLAVDDKTFQQAFEKMCTMLFQNMKTVIFQVLIEQFGFERNGSSGCRKHIQKRRRCCLSLINTENIL